MAFRCWLITLGKLLLCASALFAGSELGAATALRMGLHQTAVAPGADRNLLDLYWTLSTPLLALALMIVGRGLGARFMIRTLILSFLTWIAFGVNDQLEGLLVSTYSTGFWFAAVESLLASLLGAAAVAFLFPPGEKGRTLGVMLKAFFIRRGMWSWSWRLVIAVIIFVPIYFVFGLLVLPFVNEYYQRGMYGLKEPAVDQLVTILLVRSALFTLACLPVLIAWRDTARSLFFRLGLALSVLVGVPSILIAYWLPLGLRLPHTLEILADEFAYTGMLIALLLRGGAPASHRRRT
jgi:hypothetical protein